MLLWSYSIDYFPAPAGYLSFYLSVEAEIAMSKSNDREILSIVNPVCCGFDLHKAKISACLITVDGEGKQQYEIREYSTFTRELLKLR